MDEENPIGWEMVQLTDGERSAFCDAVDAGDEAAANKVIAAVYDRIFGEGVN